MKTIQINLYSFNELNDKAKQKAINNYRNNNYSQYYFDEIIESVKKLANILNLEFGREYTDIRTSHIDDNILELSGVRLYKYIINNYYNDLFKPKYLGCIGDNRVIKHRMSKTNFYNMDKGAIVSSSNFIYSNIQFSNSCTLTGVCYDDDILEPIYNFLKKPLNDVSFQDLINDIESSIQKCFDDTEQYINSDDFIIDEIEANEYTFESDGTLNNG